MDLSVEFLKALAEFLAMTLIGAFLIAGVIVFGIYGIICWVDSRKEKYE